ncbi:BnaA10g09060D [Brassica napus]|uniref:BnaA10g09060D protein n=2 Tax=Brassica napus TaxID=3708 RepID=A0A078FKH9_BRANA|nr:BnaA10g09060D [Brassica napus]
METVRRLVEEMEVSLGEEKQIILALTLTSDG